MVVVQADARVQLDCNGNSFLKVEKYCPDVFPKQMVALAFRKRSPLSEQISRVTEFLYGIRKAHYGKKTSAKLSAGALKVTHKATSLDLPAIKYLMFVFFAMHSMAVVVLIFERLRRAWMKKTGFAAELC